MAGASSFRRLPSPGNQLLAALSAHDLAVLQPHLQPMAMPVLTDLERPNQRIETVYFIEAGIASVVAVQLDGTRVEVGLIGREGMTGLAVVLGSEQSPHSTYIQVTGYGQRMPAKELRKAVDASETMRGFCSNSPRSLWCRRPTLLLQTPALVLISAWRAGF